MKAAALDCTDRRRRQLIRDRKLNGVDYVDVVGSHLCVHFLTEIPKEFLPGRKGAALTQQEKAAALSHIVIRGGRRVVGIRAVDVDPDEAPSKYEESCLGIELDKEGDLSTYTLCFVEAVDGRATDVPLAALDPRYSCLDFIFKTDCPAEIDCKTENACAAETRATPAISYLAKDYATFRQLILDRLALTMPGWRERHVPDIGIALVEVLAYVADYLSYYQDAVGTEQYLDTARQRISVRRHVRLIDYVMHDGCNARVFVELQVGKDDDTIEAREIYFITASSDGTPALRESQMQTLRGSWLAFEPLTAGAALKLRVAHNLIRIYTWGDEECCLPMGATRATLLDELSENDRFDPAICDERPSPPPGYKDREKPGYQQQPPVAPPPPRVLDLAAGDYLLFEELACAGTAFNSQAPGDGGFDGKTPQPDVDRTHRHVVRITKVTKACDALRGNRVLEVEWDREDAMPFALCVSAIGTAPPCDLVRNLAVARGNIVLADHGATVLDEALPTVAAQRVREICEGEDALADAARTAARYRPQLGRAPLTFAVPLDPDASAAAVLRQDPRATLPAVSLASIPPSFDGIDPLFDAKAFRDLPTLAQALLTPTDPRLVGLRRRLRTAVRKLLDAGTVTAPLLIALEANLRALTERWTARRDLLDSGSDDASFVAEVDDDGFAHLRFGDGDCGRATEVGTAFVSTYRIGNGRPGLIGPGSIARVVFRKGFSDVIVRVGNPLPSVGAVDPEPLAEVKMYAPGAFRKELGRAVTAEDYASLAQYTRYPHRNPRVQSASAALLWTGSWYEADVAIDPFGAPDLDPALRKAIDTLLGRYRRMGHDLRVGAASIVPLHLVLDLCVKPHYLRAHVLDGVREALSNRARPDGRLGFFHPDNLTFGEAIYISRIVAEAMSVDGVAEVKVVRLDRFALRKHHNPDLDKGLLRLGPNEIARLDNDPAVPENGILTFRHVRGGR